MARALQASDPDLLLREVFGHERFRPGQREAVAAALAGRDALVVMPTGSGKSLCYQLPALGAFRLSIVVSPLVALMQDQVAALRARGREDVAALSSASDADGVSQIMSALGDGGLRLLYVAPERFSNGRFRDALSAAHVDLLVVDEAHCLSEWGHDFRPDYGRLARVRDELGAPPTMALTATATPRVAIDVARRLGLRDPVEVRTGADRPNLTFDVLHASAPRRRLEILRRGLSDPDARPAIVYARSRRAVDELAGQLGGLAYHAGMDTVSRQAAQDAFMHSGDAVIVCTNAFGMGVDKADVRAVWHWNLPGSIEAYYQEAGRAGRDGAPARAVLLYAPGDRGLIGRFIREARFGAGEVERLLDALAARADPVSGAFAVGPQELAALGVDDDVRAWLAAAEEVEAVTLEPGSGFGHRGTVRLRRLGGDRRARVEQRARAVERARWEKLDALQRYAEAESCRRLALVRYLGDAATPRPLVRCCDVCAPAEDADSTPPPPADLVGTVVEAASLAAPSVGRTGVDGILRGVDAYRDRYAGHPLFGAAGRLRPAALRTAIDAAVAAGRLEVREGRYPLLLPPGGAPRRDVAPRPARAGRASPPLSDDPLAERLRDWRRGAAAAASVPAYVIAHDRTLVALAAQRPADAAELRAVRGIGERFVERHGDEVLALLRDEPVPTSGRGSAAG